MLYLWIFGDNVEDRFGHIKFTIFYLLCGLAATFAQLAFSLGSKVPNLGSIGGDCGSARRLHFAVPKGKVRVLQGQRVIQVPALIVIGIWIVVQLFSSIGSIANTAQTVASLTWRTWRISGGVCVDLFVSGSRRAPDGADRYDGRSSFATRGCSWDCFDTVCVAYISTVIAAIDLLHGYR